MGRAHLFGLVLLALAACGSEDDVTHPLSGGGKAEQLWSELGLKLYMSEYVNLVLAGRGSNGEEVALIAGSHAADFPYRGTRPWDNGLLFIKTSQGDLKLHFTHRTQGQALQIQLATGRISYRGQMDRVLADGLTEAVDVTLDIPSQLVRFKPRQLGKRGNEVFDIEEIPGMRWTPYSLSAPTGVINIDGMELRLSGIRGEVEDGIMSNLDNRVFDIAYDYVCVARGGDDGYAFVDFTSQTLRDGDDGWIDRKFAKLLGTYMVFTASEMLTLQENSSYSWLSFSGANPYGVWRPEQRDETVLLFDTEVDLAQATLQRQMIRTADGFGNTLYGLREIFVPK